MEKIVEQALLYDFYGELLTEHQRQVYEDVIMNDYSISEVAQERGISRQGVHDMIKRCGKILDDYEQKLHLVEKFVSIREKVHEIHRITKENASDVRSEQMVRIEKISEEILEEL